MLTGSTVLKRAMAFTALALPATAIGPVATGSAAAAPATSCVAEQWGWTGLTSLDAVTTRFDTGVLVPVVVGTELRVVGVSSDGVMPTGAARSMSVSVGGVVAVAGGVVPGGAVVVWGDGDVAEVRNATLVVDRCTQVAQATARRDPLVPAAEVVLPGPTSGANALPRTGGGMEIGGSLFGAVAVGVGSAMMVIGRRRDAR